MQQAVHWILTIPHHGFTPYLPDSCAYIVGQLERGESQLDPVHAPCADGEGYLHWQFCVSFKRKTRLGGVRSIFGPWHAEPTRSEAAFSYVGKDATRVEGTQFELGHRKLSRGSDKNWEAIRDAARSGQLDTVPADVYIRNYQSLKRIASDNMQPIAIVREVFVFWGPTGTGKSRRAWDEATLAAYPKDPRTKFWDGYRGQEHVVMDEFRGDIDIAHLLRWFDRYPVIVEVKGSSVVFAAQKIWITSNIPPERWFPMVDPLTLEALLRRLNITEFN